MGRKLAVAVGATLIAAFSPAIAQAANVGGVDNATTRTITYDAAMGEVNQPTITREGANVVVRDPAVTLGFTGVCAQGADTHTVVCPEGAARDHRRQRRREPPRRQRQRHRQRRQRDDQRGRGQGQRSPARPLRDVIDGAGRRGHGPRRRRQRRDRGLDRRRCAQPPVRRTGRRLDQRQLGQRRAPRRGGQRQSRRRLRGRPARRRRRLRHGLLR